MFEINGKNYIIDLDRLMSWVTETPSSEKNINTITTMTYPITNDGNNIENMEKEISETKSTLNETMNNIRYDIIRNLFNVLFTTLSVDDTIINFTEKNFSFPQKLVFNTLLSKKIIIEETKIEDE
jgi:hypothetical protein